jgi:hypothetical protein
MSGRKKARSAGGARSAPKGRTWTQRFVGAHPFSSHSAARIPRGSIPSLSMFGRTYAEANDAQKAMRREARMIGNGDYMADIASGARRVWDASRGFRQGLGSAARAGYFGKFGRGLGNISRMLGTGDYSGSSSSMVANSLVTGGLAAAGLPQFNAEQAAYTVSKVEYLTGVYAPMTAGAFQNTVFPLQPGLQETFPWLALVAANFEEYEFTQLMFTWRPMVSDFNSGTGQVGEIIMSTQYNPTDEPFTDVLRAQSYMGAMSCKTSAPMLHGVECDPNKNSGSPGKYIRLGPLSDDGSLKEYDLGKLNVIVNGTPAEYAGQLLGQIWCAYTVVLRKPKLPDSTGDTILRDYFQSGSTPSPFPPGTAHLALTPDNWGPQPVLSAEQNRIGGSVGFRSQGLPVDYMDIVYTFPSWYTGDVEIKYIILGPKELTPHVGFPHATNRFDKPLGVLLDQSTVQPIYDMHQGTALSGEGGPGPISASVEPDFQSCSIGQSFTAFNGGVENEPLVSLGQYTLVAHCRVAAQSNGKPNEVVIRFRLTAVGLGTGVSPVECQAWTLDISEYNTGFNKAGKIALLDELGNAVPSPY